MRGPVGPVACLRSDGGAWARPRHAGMAAGEAVPPAHEVMGHGGAAGMSMEAMVRDMRNRFAVAALLSIPTLLWSPIGRSVLGFTAAAPFGLRDDVTPAGGVV